MPKKVINLLPILVFTCTVLMGGGKLLFQFSITALLLISVFIILSLKINKTSIQKEILVPATLMVFWLMITFFTTKCFYPSFKDFLQFFVYAIFYITMLNYADSNKTSWAFHLLNIMQSIVVIWQNFIGAAPYGLFPDNPNLVMGFIAALTIFAAARVLFQETTVEKREKIACYISLLTGIFGILCGRSRSVLVIFIILMMILIWKKYGKNGLILNVFVLIGLIALFSIKISDKYLKINDPLAFYRPQLWYSAVKMTADNPVYGVGLGNYGKIFPRYNFPVENEALRYGKYTDFAHNEYLQMAAEAGIPGFLILLWLIYMLLRRTGKYRFLLYPSIILLFQAFFDMNLHLPANVMLLLALYAMAEQKSGNSTQIRLEKYNVYLIPALVLIGLFYAAFLASDISARKNDYAGAIKCNPLNPENYYKMAVSSQYNTAQGIKMLKNAVFLDPENYLYHSELGYIYWHLAFKDRPLVKYALEEFNSSLEKNPFNAQTYLSLGKLYFDIGEYPNTIKCIDKALQLEPNFIQAQRLKNDFLKKGIK